jgi:hypothetical protein
VNVCLMLESPLVGLADPSLAQNMPLWQPLLTTVSDAPDAAHPLKFPVSNPPFTIPPVLGAVTVKAMVVERVALGAVPVTVIV